MTLEKDKELQSQVAAVSIKEGDLVEDLLF